MPEFTLYKQDGVIKMRVLRWVLDPPDAGWWKRTFGFPYKLELVGTVDVMDPDPLVLIDGLQ